MDGGVETRAKFLSHEAILNDALARIPDVTAPTPETNGKFEKTDSFLCCQVRACGREGVAFIGGLSCSRSAWERKWVVQRRFHGEQMPSKSPLKSHFLSGFPTIVTTSLRLHRSGRGKSPGGVEGSEIVPTAAATGWRAVAGLVRHTQPSRFRMVRSRASFLP